METCCKTTTMQCYNARAIKQHRKLQTSKTPYACIHAVHKTFRCLAWQSVWILFLKAADSCKQHTRGAGIKAACFPADGRVLLTATAEGLRSHTWEPVHLCDAMVIPWPKVLIRSCSPPFCYFTMYLHRPTLCCHDDRDPNNLGKSVKQETERCAVLQPQSAADCTWVM